MEIKFIMGEAGTAKTTLITEMMMELNNFVGLSFTHSSVNNMKNMYKRKYFEKHNEEITEKELKKKFHTIHSYFQIPYGNFIKISHKKEKDLHEFIFIDEFSLIPIDIVEYIFSLISSFKRKIVLIFSGDLLQLNPVNFDKKPINVKRMNNININLPFEETLFIAEHLSNNIYSTNEFSKSEKIVLTKNYRSDTKVLNILSKALDNIEEIEIIEYSKIEKLIEDGYVVLSSRFKYLSMIQKNFQKITNNQIITNLGLTYIEIGQKFILTKNINSKLTNGDEIQIILITKDKITIGNNFGMYDFERTETIPIIPINLITIHRSQGLTLNKIIIILDDLFEITMLYTAITRAKEDVLFYVFDRKKINLLKKYNSAFKSLKKIIYQI